MMKHIAYFFVPVSTSCVIFLLCAQVSAGELQLVQDSEIGCTMRLVGKIEPGDAARVRSWLQSTREWKPSTDRLCFDSPGGSYREGIDIARALLETNGLIGTGVEANSTCASACAIAFMAGQINRLEDLPKIPNRVMHPHARVGFHAPRLEVPEGNYDATSVSTGYAVALHGMADLLRLVNDHHDMMFPESLIIAMLETPPWEMRWIETVQDAVVWDIAVYPLPLAHINDPLPRFGILHRSSEWHLNTSLLSPWHLVAAQPCIAELLRGRSRRYGPNLEIEITSVRSKGQENRGQTFEVVYTHGEDGGTCRYRLYPYLPFGNEYVPNWSIGVIKIEPSYLEEVDGLDREVGAIMTYPLDTRLRDLPEVEDPIEESNARLSWLATAAGVSEPTSCWVPFRFSTVVNATEYVNLRAAPDISSEIIGRIPLGETVHLQYPDRLLFSNADAQQKCHAACAGASGLFQNRSDALVCIDRNEIWLQTYRGFLSRKFLQ